MSSKSQSSPKKTTQKPSKKRKNVETQSASSSATRKRFASEDSALAGATSNLRLSFGSSASYDLEDLPSSASKFKIRDMEALRVNFLGASSKNDVIPNVQGTRYIASTILSEPNTYNLNIV